MSATESIMQVLATLRADATMCPGELARRLETTQAALRPVLAVLAESGRIRITQRGEPADLRTLRGPYRVAGASPQKSPGARGDRGRHTKRVSK